MVRKKITVARERSSGLNTHFNVPGHGVLPRGRLADQIERGEHPDYHIRIIGGRRIPVSNPDGSDRNNLG